MDADDTPVIHEDHGISGRYVIRLTPHDAEMTWRRVDDTTIAIDHTLVPQEHRNRGLAEKLVRTAIADARRTGTRIVPVCSYVAAQFRRHPEWADLRA